ncbi:MAG TPA: PAS domain S-box protein [Tepidiformaceae bacterium]
MRKDRTTLTLDVFVKQVEWAGALAVLSIATDITIQKRAEEALRASEYRLRRLFETAPDGILILDADTGQVIDANPFMQDLLGYSVDEFLGKKLWEVGPFKAVVASKTTFAELRLKDRLHYETLPLETKDGRRIEVEFVSNAYQVNEKRLIQCNIRDITERVQLEAQFRQAQKMESVGQLASGIAHDFNNLLTVINGMSELLLAQVNQDDPMRADVQEISRAGERAATLTRQLLAFSRQQILESRVLDCNMIVSGMESLLGRLLGEDIELVVKLTQGVGRVKVDPEQIEQVLSNLAVNARDAMPQGGQLTIETENVTTDQDYARQHGVAVPPGPYVLLTVSDSGVGMDEATRARIFEPFFTTKGPGKGTGLGLSTVYGVVKQSLGFVWVYSEVGRGTSFKILLPQVTEAAGTDRPEPAVASSTGTETILLAEDNAGLRKLATRVLEPAGYTVLGTASGEEALRLLERHEEPVHLLLSDVVMPGMSGRQLAERIAETRPGMKVLYMSGYTSDTIVRHGVLEARVPFLNKPFTGAALLRKVREVLDS